MTRLFHRNLNRMALFTALLAAGVALYYREFLNIAASNIYLNGIIIGTTLFGIGICFIEMFKLLPEYKWMCLYFQGRRNVALPPRLLRPVALMLRTRPSEITAPTLNSMLDMIMVRFEDSRESIRYITNTLIFLGLLGTFWGLIMTVGGFADLIGNLNFDDESVMLAMQQGLSRPLTGMSTAFTSSLLGLGGSLAIGFLGLQVQLAQNTIFRELEEYLSARTRLPDTTEQYENIKKIVRELNSNTKKIGPGTTPIK